MFPRTSSRKAFTLIELLVVIAIIAILAALVLPLVRNSIQRAEATKCMANLKQIGTAIQSHVNDLGKYPDNVWDRQILPYLGVEDIPKTGGAAITTPGLAQKLAVFHCPSDRAPRTAVPGSYPRSYSILGWVVGAYGWVQSGTPKLRRGS
jgi:prepilin-type N-terminal cleavage/methylation domain-containing protein